MNRHIIKSRIGSDGILHITLPVGAADANREVQVTVEPIDPTTITQQEWHDFILSTAGSVPDPTFRRHQQGEYEPREELP